MNAIEWTVELRFALALALGFLVGLERESVKIEQRKLVFAGVRTHPLISMLGFACAWLSSIGVTSVLPVAMGVLGVLAGIAYVAKTRQEHYGATSEVSALLTFVTGAMAFMVDVWGAMALGVLNALLLSEKAKLESYVEKLDRAEFLAILKFLIVSVIILPVLPDRDYTTFRINPASVWKIVILVSTIGFVGYYFARRYGNRVGLWLSGLLGGIASSTAVTIAVGRYAQRESGASRSALQSALLAGAVMYPRVLVIVAIMGPVIVEGLWWKLLVLSLAGVAMATTLRARGEERSSAMPELQNPFEITPALLFAAAFVVLLVATRAVLASMGEGGIVGLSLLVGVADVDPFIISIAQSGSAPALAQRVILLAAMSNTIAKGVYFWTLAREVRRETAWRYGLWAALHLPLAFLG